MKKKDKKIYRYVLGIDIGGATRMGVALFDMEEKQLLVHKTIRRIDSKTNLEHRMRLVNTINEIRKDYHIDVLIFESIRLFSYGRIQMSTILSLCKVQTTIINEFSGCFDIYSVDVRSWKSKVLGSAKADKNDAIRQVMHKFPEVNIFDEIVKPRKKETVIELNHDLADAILISQVLKFDSTILQEKNKMNYK